MMRYLLVAALLMLATPAAAQACKQVEPAAFVAAGVAALQAGEFKGAALTGAEAADFAEDSEIESDTAVIATFMVTKDGTTLFIFVDAASACMFEATEDGLADFKARYGRES